jgi:hypothetical protein
MTNFLCALFMIDIACSAVISTGRLTPALVSIATVAGTMRGFAGSLVSALAEMRLAKTEFAWSCTA